MHNLTVLFDIFSYVSMMSALVSILLCVLYDKMVKGTRTRYIYASIILPLLIFTIGLDILTASILAAQHRYIGASVWILSLITMGRVLMIVLKNKDDNFWKKMKRGIKNWITSSKLSPAMGHSS
jgi:hypothetical protein